MHKNLHEICKSCLKTDRADQLAVPCGSHTCGFLEFSRNYILPLHLAVNSHLHATLAYASLGLAFTLGSSQKLRSIHALKVRAGTMTS